MAKRIGTSRTKTRSKLKKQFRRKGKISMSNYFQSFNEGDRVYLSVEPAIQKGFYFPRFFGKSGVVKGKQGRCYEILIKDFKKQKTVICLDWGMIM